MTTFKWKVRLWWVRMRVQILTKKLRAIQSRIAGRERHFLAQQMELPLRN